MSTADRVDVASEALNAAIAHVAAAVLELSELRRVEGEATAKFDDSGSDKALESLTRARLRRERAERLEHQARASEAEAQTRLAVVEREATAELLAIRSRQVEAWRTEVLGEVERLITLDREADAVITRIAKRIADAEDAYVEATTLAESIGQTIPFQRTATLPSLRDARKLLASAMAAARADEERGATALWFAGAEQMVSLHPDVVRALGERGIAEADHAAFVDRAVRDAIERGRHFTEYTVRLEDHTESSGEING